MSVDSDSRKQIADAAEHAIQHMRDPTPVQVLSKITNEVPDGVAPDEATAVIETVLDSESNGEFGVAQNGGPQNGDHDIASAKSGEESQQEPLTRGDVRDHHQRIKDAVEPLGAVAGNPTMLVNDKKGWYVTRANTDPSDEEIGTYEKKRRARDFTQDYDDVVEGALERTLYALTSYKRPEAFDRWKAATLDQDAGEYDYLDSKPAPEAADIAAISAWGDVDLADGLKGQRPDLDAETYDVAETALDAYVSAFADLYGGRGAVYVLDSVGGAYIFGAPEATLPISRHYEDDEDARERVFAAFIERSNEFLQDAEEHVNETVDGAADVVHPDWANNINRQYKMPLTLHGDHDAVVTPIDPEDITYREPTPVADVDEGTLARAHSWCEEFTSVDFEDRVAVLVETLWPDKYDEHGDWQAALDAWVEAEREAEREQRRQREAARQRREERLEELGSDLEGTPITPFIQDVYDALDAIDTGDVIKNCACDAWDTGVDSSSKTEFDPSWRTSSSGSSCYVDHDKNTFGDPGDGGGGYAAKAMALGERIISDASESLNGEQWGQAVDALRDAGYDVPIWTPEKGSTRRDGGGYDQMPLWAIRKAAVALGVVPEDVFVKRDGDNGGSYLGFPGPETYNNVLDALEDHDLEHGREHLDTGPSHPTYDLVDREDNELELHLVPINGKEVRIEIHQNGQREYTEKQERGCWDSGTKRGRIAGRAVDEITGYDKDLLREAIKDALNQVALDADEDWFEEAMRSPREEELRDRTQNVVCYPQADDARWVITMEPSETAPEESIQQMEFDAGQLHNADPGHFQALHLGVFLEKVQLDSAEWQNLVDYWLEIQEHQEREPDTKLEAALENFLSAINKMRVWADQEGFDWDSRNGYYAEDFENSEDAVLVPGRWVMQWKSDNDYGDLMLPKELRQRGIMLTESKKTTIGDHRHMAWPIDASETDWARETAQEVVDDEDEDDEDKPEGLRD